jgi:hypothetical protein
MKIAVRCDSPLLEKSLNNFLKESITPIANSDIVISDKKIDIHKPLFIIGNSEHAHLRKPFSRATLLLQLERFSENRFSQNQNINEAHSAEELKARIADITEEYLQKVYYEIDRYANT